MPPTIQQVVDDILSTVPGAPIEDTVDTFKAGDPSKVVTGIVTTFLASLECLREAQRLGANFVITHEPTFYNHRDQTDWLKDNPVYQAKRKLLDETGIAVWRFHDHWHRHRPEGIMMGVIGRLGWSSYADPANDYLFEIPPVSLGELVAFLKGKLDVGTAKVVGSRDLVCRRVGLLPGAAPGEWLIRSLGEGPIDVLVAGEASEWQVYEYARDAVSLGLSKGLVMLGHERTEEPGMAYLAEWLREMYPEVPISHVPSGEPMSYQ